MKLEEIGFYTLSDDRAKNVSKNSDLYRCELILTDACNFKCPYCRGIREDCAGTMPLTKAQRVIDLWAKDNLKNIRFSGGEPTVYKHLPLLVKQAKECGVNRIAISTNGSSNLDYYKYLIECGVNDFSISLDACCSSFGNKMTGTSGVWQRVVENIRELSKAVYVTTGIVFTEDNVNQAVETVKFAHDLGVSDIRVISAAQYNRAINDLSVLGDSVLSKHPILKYRIYNFRQKRNVRGMLESDNHYCPLVLDDMAIAGDFHFPCIIYLREGGSPIGRISNDMRNERYNWFKVHNCYADDICRKNCLDVCIDYNNKVMKLNKEII